MNDKPSQTELDLKLGNRTDVNYKMTVDFGLGAATTDTPLKRAKDCGVQELVDILTAAGAKE